MPGKYNRVLSASSCRPFFVCASDEFACFAPLWRAWPREYPPELSRSVNASCPN
jgi:hypothetical protein